MKTMVSTTELCLLHLSTENSSVLFTLIHNNSTRSWELARTTAMTTTNCCSKFVACYSTLENYVKLWIDGGTIKSFGKTTGEK